MADASVASRPRAPARAVLGLACLALPVLLLPGAARADYELELEFPSRAIVDKGAFEDAGDYLSKTSGFLLEDSGRIGEVVMLLLRRFFVPETPPVFGEFFSFEIEDPDSPGTFAFEQDVPFTWDQDSGEVVSDTFRVKLTFDSFGTQQVSYYDLTLTTEGVAPISCPPGNPTNSHGGLTGLHLPTGPLPPAGARLRLVASACAVEENGLPNELPGHIVVVEINARLAPIASVPALSSWASALLGACLVASALWALGALRARPAPLP